MEIVFGKRTKSLAVRYGAFKIFGKDKNDLKTDEEREKRFDEIWKNELELVVEKAFKNKKLIQPNAVKDLLRKKFKKSSDPFQDLDINKLHYQFIHEVLCVVQIEYFESLDRYLIEQMWTFSLSDADQELFCFLFGSIVEKTDFEEFARLNGRSPQEFARISVIKAVENIKEQQNILDKYRRSLHHAISQKAQYGIDTPIHIINTMYDCRKNIERIKQLLSDWQIRVEDHPDDFAE